ncbi:phenylacetic acid degradation operon negative regulatory protein [Allopseudospirillum japonicum]|uniref:Phenylacetic acid degradation operon negative regulatory protein n=1 Tax=Allopseudospirillum japonicum TaxID=64971 RepID=A0A1H6T397_9GAMM|nr:phenylacetic acid degradation operon negative regulatory protein PaaX [Allopseudospirillum japonicum]SEI70740.1 phenylacetic acid degradation operon negative regulatory protein [Allopseudospirillum japonicum]
MQYSPHLNYLIDAFREQRPIRAGSLIITIYGDAIAPRGGTVWLGSLIHLLEPLGLSQRLVRTSVFRLSKESWLLPEQIGRRSYYSLTASGRRRFEKAFKRVYVPVYPDWDGTWCLAVLSQLSAEQRRTVREELEWMGFGALAPTVLAHPRCDRSEVMATLQELDALDHTLLFETKRQDPLASKALRQQACECWNLQQLSDSYRNFLNRFRPVWQELKDKSQLDPQECFIARTLMIHEYRKVLLRDPLLPEELLPVDWEGRSARQLCRNLYRLIYAAAEQHLSQILETAEGPLPEPSPAFYKRFGGLN